MDDETTLLDMPPPDPVRNHSDIRELRREQGITRSELRELRAALRAQDAELQSLRSRYSLVAGMTPAQLTGAAAGVMAGIVTIVNNIPAIIRALGWGP